MANEKANAHSELLPKDVTSNHIVRLSTNTASGNTKMFINKMLSPIEITRAEASTINTDNGGDGAWLDGRWYRITNPLTPLINVTMQALKDSTGFARLTMSGIANIATGSGFIHVECGYNPLTNTIYYIYEPKYNVRIEGTSSYGVIPLDNSNFFNIHFTNITTIIPNEEDAYITNIRASNGTITITSSGLEKCLLKDVSVTLSGNGFLSKCVLLGNDESIVFPSGEEYTGKTFISGVSSTFEYELDLTIGSIYDAAAFGGVGEITIPAGLGFIGKFIPINGFVTCALIQGIDSWCGAVEFTVNNVAYGVLLSTVTPSTMTTAGECVTDEYYNGAAVGIYSFDGTGAPYGYCKLIKRGGKNLITERVGL